MQYLTHEVQKTSVAYAYMQCSSSDDAGGGAHGQKTDSKNTAVRNITISSHQHFTSILQTYPGMPSNIENSGDGLKACNHAAVSNAQQRKESNESHRSRQITVRANAVSLILVDLTMQKLPYPSTPLTTSQTLDQNLTSPKLIPAKRGTQASFSSFSPSKKASGSCKLWVRWSPTICDTVN